VVILLNILSSVKRFSLIVILLIISAVGTLLLFDLFIQTPINLPNFIDQSIRVIVIVGFWLIILTVIRRSKKVLTHTFGDQPTTMIQIFLGSIAVLVMVFALLNELGVSPNSLLVGAGIASITIGLIISTFVGGVLSGALVFATQKFKVGDSVMVNNIPGKIIALTALATRVRTDFGQITIPNGAIASGAFVITILHPYEISSQSRLPYSKGDRVVTTYMQGEGSVKEITSLHTVILLDSGKELTLQNNSILSGSVAVAKITQRLGHDENLEVR
jgi:small-conductance mechanosensitive channel